MCLVISNFACYGFAFGTWFAVLGLVELSCIIIVL